jgi:hypothetical protein
MKLYVQLVEFVADLIVIVVAGGRTGTAQVLFYCFAGETISRPVISKYLL